MNQRVLFVPSRELAKRHSERQFIILWTPFLRPKDLVTIALPIVVFARDDVPDEVVHCLAKTVAGMKQKLEKANCAFKMWQPEWMVKGLEIEVHPGARKYYEERGWM